MDLTGIGSIADLLKTGLDKIFPDPIKKAEAAAALLQAENAGALKEIDQAFQLQLEQIKANAAEASQPGFHFRDGAGWVCVIAMGTDFVIRPIATWIAVTVGHPLAFPALDVTILGQMLFALLGLGGMHAYQQVKSNS